MLGGGSGGGRSGGSSGGSSSVVPFHPDSKWENTGVPHGAGAYVAHGDVVGGGPAWQHVGPFAGNYLVVTPG